MTMNLDKPFLAAANENADTLKESVDKYLDKLEVTALTDDDSRTIAHYACLYNTEDVALYVLKQWQCDSADVHGALPYMYAARRGFLRYVQDWPGDVTRTEENNRNALHYLCGGGADSKPSIEGIEVPEDDPDQASLITCAEHLVSRGVDISQLDNLGKTPLQYAWENGLKEVGKWLVSKHAHSVIESLLAGMERLTCRVENLEEAVESLSSTNTELTQTVEELTLQIEELKNNFVEDS